MGRPWLLGAEIRARGGCYAYAWEMLCVRVSRGGCYAFAWGMR